MKVNLNHTLMCAALTALCSVSTLEAQVRTDELLERGWKFSRDDRAEFALPAFNDAKWQSVTIPHDWAIYGPFSIHNDMQNVAIAQDGQTEAMEQAGRTGGLPFVGTGWYRLSFEAPAFKAGKSATLVFDGAMSHARVYVNGHEAGYWPYGYNSFYVDATPFLCEGEKNELAVRLENEPESSRWYPGAGLYRNVHLVITDGAHIPTWGTYVTTPVANERVAKVVLKTQLALPAGADRNAYRLHTDIKDPEGRIVATGDAVLSRYADDDLFEQEFPVDAPALWSPESPSLYTAESKLYGGTELCDEYTTRFGIRSIEVIPGKGFFLNGQPTKFRGVCNHHDLGPLGAAINVAALRRQVSLLKEMGCNAIRTSHNMPAPELVSLCDEMGMMLMCETFDEWQTPKMANGYHKVFDEWADRDITNLVRQFRNNPSVVMWCIGNEVPDQWDNNLGEGHAAKLARQLQDIFHREDPTRPVTQGMDQWQSAVYNGVAATMDIPGFNYRSHRYAENHAHLPQDIILGSETASTVSSRGVYRFPVERVAMRKYDDHQSSSYDLEYCDWSNLPEDDWLWHDDHDWAIGEFVWTGFDYLGEPTPYYTDWPSHSSLFGIIDLAGLPKDRYYLYRSHWNPEAETLHVLPHWTWPGREGQTTPIFVYTNYPSAEVFINGVSQGRRTKDLTVTAENSADSTSLAQLKRQSRYRLMWMDTKYEPGTVRVVAYDNDGRAVAETEVQTAGAPDHLELTADRTNLTADGRDLAFVTVKVVDKEGRLCPDAQHLVKYAVKGKGTYRAGANGDPICLEQFHLPQMHVFNGMMTAIVQTTDEAGEIILTASAKGLKSGKVTLKSSPAQ
jgi:beta-galactosidase